MALFDEKIGTLNNHKLQRKLDASAAELSEIMRESQKVLELAGRQAEQILEQTEIFSKETQAAIRGRLLSAAESVGTESRHVLDTIIEHQKEILESLSVSLKAHSEEHFKQLSAHTASLLTQTRAELSQQALAYGEEMKKSLRQVAHEEQEKIRQRLSERLPEILNEVVGKAISVPDQEKIIQEALKKATSDIQWN
ncbi:MAG: hypothetical protein HYR90_00060 [Candidatus Andersenbacteria bacterium]|nr:hypothetical protein [Candidatus Andersenbacteria bacterium]MBI3250800.1 hypothetical protein [Candidatus Andersenbacteria bacterium]